MIGGYFLDNAVPLATASAESGIPAAKIVEAYELPEGLLVISTGNHVNTDAGDALPSQLLRSA